MSGRFSRALIVLLCLILCAALSPAAFAEDGETPVTVIFSCEDESALPGLHVFDQAGAEYAPITDEDSGVIQYGRFLLMPGEYSYSFHDEEGRYEDFADIIKVFQAIKYYIPIDLTPIIEIQSFSFTYIDPIYEGIITEADIPDISVEQETTAVDALRELAKVEANSQRRFYAIQYWKENVYYDTIEDAALFLRSQIANFQDTATLGICSDVELNASSLKEKLLLIWAETIAHTGNPTEGDYLRYEYGGYKVESYSYKGNEDNLYYYQIPFSLLHYTNATQESELTPIVDSVLAELDLNGKSDYQKIHAIYDYLCSTVEYGGSGDIKFTAYGALINHAAYCQGYATAFYRLCLSVGVDTRVITRFIASGSPDNHAWNIAALDGLYYELDATWDANYTPTTYKYFLKGKDYWESTSHSTIGDQFSNSAFAASYPLSVTDAPTPFVLMFNTNGGSTVLPQYVMSGEQAALPVSPTKNGYWFTGWYTDSDFTTLFDFDTAVTADTTVYARWAVPDFMLPAALSQIGEEAFSGGAFTFAVLPENAVTVGPLAFADCDDLLFIYIPTSVEDIDSTAFGDVTDLTILGTSAEPQSAAESFASSHGYAFVPISK